MEKNMRWDVTISQADYGYIVRVGCKTLVFEDWKSLSDELDAYASGNETPMAKELKKNCLTTAGPESLGTAQSQRFNCGAGSLNVGLCI